MYKYRFLFDHTTPLDKHNISLVSQAMWRVNTKNGMSASGYTKLLNGAIVFTSNNEEDILVAKKNGCWDTKRKFKNVLPGTVTYIIPCSSMIKKTPYPEGIRAVATTDMFELDADSTPIGWLLEKEELVEGSIIIMGKS